MRETGEQMTENKKACALGVHPCQPRNLAEAVHCVARHSRIDTHHLADALEVDYSTFIRWTEPSGLCQMPARKFALLANVTGRFDHIAWVASDADLVVVKRATAASAGERVRELLDVVDQVGRLAATDRAASADLVIAEDERLKLRAIVQSLCREITEYEQALR